MRTVRVAVEFGAYVYAQWPVETVSYALLCITFWAYFIFIRIKLRLTESYRVISNHVPQRMLSIASSACIVYTLYADSVCTQCTIYGNILFIGHCYSYAQRKQICTEETGILKLRWCKHLLTLILTLAYKWKYRKTETYASFLISHRSHIKHFTLHLVFCTLFQIQVLSLNSSYAYCTFIPHSVPEPLQHSICSKYQCWICSSFQQKWAIRND